MDHNPSGASSNDLVTDDWLTKLIRHVSRREEDHPGGNVAAVGIAGFAHACEGDTATSCSQGLIDDNR